MTSFEEATRVRLAVEDQLDVLLADLAT